jgi:galactokinase
VQRSQRVCWLSVQEEMEIAYQGEIKTPSKCGRMDQCCAFGKNKLVLMKFDGEAIESKEINTEKLKNDPLFIVLVDLRAFKDTKKILSDLQKGFPFAETQEHLHVQELLGPTNERIISQVVDSIQDINQGASRIGQLMNEAQRYFDSFAVPACPDQLKAPKLHKILQYPLIQDLIYGGKGVGSQGDGSAQFLCKDQECQDRLVQILEKDFDVECLKMSIGIDMT